MSHRIFPSLEERKQLTQPLTKGEEELIEYLDKYLPKDKEFSSQDRKSRDKLIQYNGWLIFVQPYLNGLRPDIIIFNPYIGLQIFEVKDYQLEHYKYEEHRGKNNQFSFKVRNPKDQRFYNIRSPQQQVYQYKKATIELLDSRIGEEIDKNQNAFALVRTSIFFSKEKYEKLESFFKINLKIGQGRDKDIVFGLDDLNKDKIKDIIPDVYGYIKENGIKKSKYWKSEWNKNILFWLLPPEHSIEQGEKIQLTAQQQKIVTPEDVPPEKRHRRIQGVAGSGKTLVLAYRAAKLASQGKKVLILSFNITLWHIIRDFIQRCPFKFSWGNFTFNHYHEFLKKVESIADRQIDQSLESQGNNTQNAMSPIRASIRDMLKPEQLAKILESYEIDLPQDEDKDNNTQQREKRLQQRGKRLQNNIKNMNLDGYQYDAILIDEGQDYKYEWYQFLTQNFLNKNDECFVASDKGQNIYERNLSWLDKRIDRNKKDMSKFGDWENLNIIYRLPPNIHVFISKFKEFFKIKEEIKSLLARDKDITKGQKTLGDTQGQVIAENTEKLKEDLLSNYKRLTKEKICHPSDIAILVFTHKQGSEIVNFLTEKIKGLKINHIFKDSKDNNGSSRQNDSEDNNKSSRRNKKSFWMGDSRLKVCTIHSFKGWEIDNVFLLIPKELQDDNLVYVGMTRSKSRLFILNQSKKYLEFIKNNAT